jgi:carbon-monoxide dehydrogenase large subunit
VRGRSEDRGLVTGHARFVEDLATPGTLWAGFVRSDIAHGRVRNVDLSDIESGSEAVVFLNQDLGLDPQPGKLRESLPGHVEYRRPILADDVVRFAGEAVALVVADSEQSVTETIDRIWLDIDELPAVLTVDQALADQTVLHPAVGTNRAVTASFGSGGAPRWGVGPEIEMVVESPRLAAVPMEPLSIMAIPTERGLEVACGTQTPHRLRVAIAENLGFAPEDVRVVVPEVGGGFGQKGAVYVEFLAVARAAQLLQRPVLWAQRRRDNLRSATHGRGARHRIRLGGLPDGTLTQAEIEIVTDLGAYPQMGGVVPVTSASMAPGPYQFERFAVEAIGVLTNLNPTGPYRGAGRPEATYVLERAIDTFARSIGVSPHEVRRRSLLPAHTTGAPSGTGIQYDSGDYRTVFDLACDAIDPEGVASERGRRLEAGERKSVGTAVTCFIERAGGPVEFGEHAFVELKRDGALELRVGTSPTGQGHRTVFTGIVAETFGVEPRSIGWVSGDTDAIAMGGGTYGSRSGQLGGSATLLAARDLAEQCRRLAADVLQAGPDEVILTNGKLRTEGDRQIEITLGSLAAVAADRGVALVGESHFKATSQTFPYGAHGAVVDVDLDTGVVEVRRVVAVDDCGTVLNPMIAAGQIQGSLAQGLGQAMLERVAVSEDGGLLTGTLMDHLLPTATDVPAWELHHTEIPADSNPLGAKGVGESGTIGLPAAIVNAVLDALAPFGVVDLEMPLTPARVWAALASAGTP